MKSPEFTGLLLTNEIDVSERKNLGKIALWKNRSTNENAPVLQGEITTETGRKFRVALWKFKLKEWSFDPFIFHFLIIGFDFIAKPFSKITNCST